MAGEQEQNKRRQDEKLTEEEKLLQIRTLMDTLLLIIAPYNLPTGTRLRRMREAVHDLGELQETICTPTRHSWQHELGPAGEELEMSGNRVWKYASAMDRLTWVTKSQFYLYITTNAKSEKLTGLPLARSEVRQSGDLPSMMVRLILRDLWGAEIETLAWWPKQTQEEQAWLRKIKPMGQWKRAVEKQRLQWAAEGVTVTPSRLKPKIDPLGEGSVIVSSDSDSDKPLVGQRAAKKKAAKEAEEQAAKKNAAREAEKQAARKKAEKEAEEQAARKKAEKEAEERAAKKKAAREAEEQATRKKEEKEAEERAANKRKAEKEAEERAARRKAEDDAAKRATQTEDEARIRPVFEELYPMEGLTTQEREAIFAFVDGFADPRHFPHMIALMERGRVPVHVSSTAATDFIMSRLLRPQFTSSMFTNSRWLREARAIRALHPLIPREWAVAIAANQQTLGEMLPQDDQQAAKYAKHWWGDKLHSP